MAELGYDDPEGDVEDEILQFRLRDGQNTMGGYRPRVVTIVFPDSFIEGSSRLGWSRELMVDFLLMTFSGLTPDGITITALLKKIEKRDDDDDSDSPEGVG